ncbi:MAG: protein kinase [Proteobacteria bacterium]|nr:protein kinase [Pseudomonadota bacterium]
MPSIHKLSLVAERFQVEQMLGEGGMGRVWRATDIQTGQRVALKELTDTNAPVAQARFLREAELLASLSDPGIVQYVGHGVWNSITYLAMEWLHGETLSEYLVSLRIPQQSAEAIGGTTTAVLPAELNGEMSEEAGSDSRNIHAPLGTAGVIAMGARLAAAVAKLHQHDIIHRDIKPSNLFLVDGELSRVKLIDLGVARSLSSDQKTLTRSGVIIGTPHYMAPEQAQAHASSKITPAVDVWAIGCVLYQCLTGFRPFDGYDVLGVLTNILLGDAVHVGERRKGIPSALADTVMQTLCKEPSARLTAVELASELDRLSSIHVDDQAEVASDTPQRRRLPDRAELLTDAERRVMGVLVITGARRSIRGDGEGNDDQRDRLARDMAEATIVELGQSTSIQDLVDGTRLITFGSNSSLLFDQVARAARAAIALRKHMPWTSMAVAMCSMSEGASLVGTAVQSSADKLSEAAPGTILLDDMSASMLESQFALQWGPLGATLLKERTRETARTMLGNESPWVGRRREISWLGSALEECVEDSVARAVLVTGPDGMGKSRLWQELLKRLQRGGEECDVLCGRGDSFRIGSPFSVVSTALNAWAGLDPRDPPAVQWDGLKARLTGLVAPHQVDRFTVGLSAMLGMSGPSRDNPMSAAARENPVFLRQLVEEAWLGWLRALCDRRLVLLILDDLQWGDQLSVSYVDVALRELSDRPLMVLALARPEVQQHFPRLWARRGLSEFPLHPLTASACTRYARALLSDNETDASVIQRIVQRSGGNAFCLEELVRAVVAGTSELPDTVLGTVQARLDSLGAKARRVLRAASVFGMEFTEGGVAALVGNRVGHFHPEVWLGLLVQEEVIEKKAISHLSGQTGYAFRHALMRDAAYALLTEDDQKLAHRRAGDWLAEVGEPSPLVLAEHFIRGNAAERAAFYLVEAAERALNAGDLGGVIIHGARAIELGATGALCGRAHALMSAASDWLEEYQESQKYGLQALDELPAGTGLWFTALGSALMSSTRMPDQVRISELVVRLRSTRAAEGAERERLGCLCHVAFGMMMWADAEELATIRAEIETAAKSLGDLPPQLNAQYQEFEGWHSAAQGNIVDSLARFRDSAAVYDESGMIHHAANARAQLGYLHILLGEFEQARELCERLIAECEPSNTLTRRYLRMWICVARCRSRAVPSDQAVDALREIVEEYRQTDNQPLLVAAQTFAAEAEYARGNFADARILAEKASAVGAAGGRVAPWVSAVHALALVRCSELQLARDQIGRAIAQKNQFGGSLQGHLIVPWAEVEVHEALGDRESAARALRFALDELVRMRELAGAERGSNLLRLRESKRLLQLAKAWGIDHNNIGV